MANYLTFAELYQNVERAIKDDAGAFEDQSRLAINPVYLNEILQADDLYPLHWLLKFGIKKVVAASTISNITQADPAVVTTSSAHNLTEKDIITIWNVEGMTEVNCHGSNWNGFTSGMFRVGTVLSSTTFNLLDMDGNNVDSTGFTAYSSGGNVYHQGWSLETNIEKVIGASIYENEPLVRTSFNEILSNLDAFWSDNTSTPDQYLHWKYFDSTGTEFNHFVFAPGAQEADAMNICYQMQAPRLENDTDVPLLPFSFHPAIVAGAVTRLAENNVQVENAVIWPSIYAAQ